MQPTLAGFLTFITTVMGIDAEVLPPTEPVIAMAFAIALSVVNRALQCIGVPSTDAAGATLNSGGWTIYAVAVYNLAGDNLLNFAQDQPGQTYFGDLRKQLNLDGFVSGVIQSSSDKSTSNSMVVQEAAKAFTLANLQNLKTIYGRRYLALAQSAGPTTGGMN